MKAKGDIMVFWIIVSVLALVVAATFGIALMRRRTKAEPAAAYDLRVYRDQLKDVDRDLARGVIAAADADRIRAEVSRRILAADAQMRADGGDGGQPRTGSLVMAVLAGVVLIGGSLAIYTQLGTPGYGDMPRAGRLAMAEARAEQRPSQAEIEARMPPAEVPQLEDSYANLLDQLRAKVAERPDDLQGHILLARHEANIGNYAAAREAQTRVMDLKGAAVSADDHAEMGELLILSAGGYVSPEAQAELRAALDADPTHGPARYYWGLMLAQIGRPDMAFDLWEETLRMGPRDAPWLIPIRAQIEEIAWRAGVDFALPDEPAAPALAGPTAEDMQAAGEMGAEDRQAMIAGMVEGLAERLQSDGGSAEEWARLVNALAVLGEPGRAQAALDQARRAHSGDAAALAALDAAAAQAGLLQ
jgi:cytochrome c-type biogenesis protein CcmH